jgi:hypothetical protein
MANCSDVSIAMSLMSGVGANFVLLNTSSLSLTRVTVANVSVGDIDYIRVGASQLASTIVVDNVSFDVAFPSNQRALISVDTSAIRKCVYCVVRALLLTRDVRAA